ncbi:chromatin DNA-binding EKC/KEOPS complex subunit GON7 NDAI_0B00370 [Naumovozyma dairenensis CBS 421]|uniref:EKC/KEOPS complex subunit GON7 n=1 Tax=Naumovozyma dairenensis (strain ATCC 10597 / BCRC 20456 / CBS 421 / NBRC 0211 / NRRL Y-12639) TaxID=1071378 RepID=G0W5L0_NAUDC|nr:hypothetical protein NDAI_0B00370 [Naumovozyma dairenensis CBS 421]CCD23071.1 hypothetical protein NDAI_0B00370 [Naumovozyma dairenensis CBS 421]
MGDLITAKYSSPDIPELHFTIDVNDKRYQTTNGMTTGPSEHVLNAGQIDRDRPSDPKLLSGSSSDVEPHYTELSKLRMHLTGLQDDINIFLTEQMELAKKKKIKLHSEEEEKRIDEEINELLDGGDGDEEDEDEGK